MLFFITVSFFKNKIQLPTGFIITLPILGLCLFAYVAFSKYQLNNYYKQALTSPEQTRQGIIKEKGFYF